MREIYESNNIAFFPCEPQNFEKATKEDIWINAMDGEIATIEKNNTWEMMDLPEGKEIIG